VFGEWVWVARLHSELVNSAWIGEAVLVTDVRFANELRWIAEQEGVIIYIQRDDAPVIATHSSEDIPTLEYCQLLVEQYGGSLVCIENNSSLDDLAQAIKKQVVPLLQPA
jgi:hypothetical protein